MPQISLTDFVDVVSRSGTPKANKVTLIKNRLPYNPAFDFYKAIREHIVSTHKLSNPKSKLANIMGVLTDPKKTTVYPDIVAGYNKWWGKKKLAWFDPPTGLFSKHDIDVSINPELGLDINGKKHLVKLYFKADKLTKNRVDIITHLMAIVLNGKGKKGVVMSVLDVRNSKLISPTLHISNLNAILDAELAYISALWKQV